MKKIVKNFNKKGFSLIELSVVLVIISILIAGTLSVSVSSINAAKSKVTSDKAKAIYQAMGSFLLKNYRLPCPANITLAKTTSGYGTESTSGGACAAGTGVYTAINQSGIMYGMVPTTTLGLPADMAEDGYGNKFAYVVTAAFGKAEYPSTSNNSGFSFSAVTGDPMIKIIDQPSANVTDGNIFAIISQGQNKFGSFNSTSTAQNGTSSDSDEALNYLTGISGTTANFGVSGAPYATSVVLVATSTSSDVFDDYIFFKSKANMIADFDANFLTPCAGTTYLLNGNNYTISNSYFGSLANANRACATPGTTTPTWRCVAGGNWTQVTTCAIY